MSRTLDLNALAPSFKLIDIFDREISLDNYKGKKVFIAFFRHVGCPFCNSRLQVLKETHPYLKSRGLEMIFFFESSKEHLLKSKYHRGLDAIPIISDTDKKWYDAYGVQTSLKKTLKSVLGSSFRALYQAVKKKIPFYPAPGKETFGRIPAEFLIDEQGIIKNAHYSNNLTNRMPIKAIISFATRN